MKSLLRRVVSSSVEVTGQQDNGICWLTAVNSLYVQLSVHLFGNRKATVSKVLKSQLVAFEMYIDFKLLCAVKQM